ncbi:MAG: hypothetical protein IJW64_02655 [Clostridia bacterium]|nr:hypothetical protein [Clostridia bacterium]
MYEKYYLKKDVNFNTYAYSVPGCELGDYVVEKSHLMGKRTVEEFKTYKEVGFNMVMSGCIATYYGEEWETSMCKRAMDVVYQAGIDKYIVGDQAFYDLSCQKDGIIGEGKRFDSEESLDKFVANRIKDYSKHPAFYGIYLKDEPHYYLFKSFGQIYRSIKRVCPKAFIYCNLLPLDTLRWMDERYPKGGDLFERRTKYLELFLNETGADYIKYDDYPFCYNKENKVLYIWCLQNAAEICRDKNLEFQFIAQSFSMKIGEHDYYWTPNEQEMRYQLNLLLGFGVKELGFFTYMSHGANSTEWFYDDGAMLTRNSEKTPLYFITQKVIKELWDIIPLVTQFTYNRSAYEVATFNSFLKQLDYAKCEKLDGVDSFSTDKEGVLINELYDKDNDQYLYRVINMTEVRCEKMQGVKQTTEINFDKKFTKADVFENGKWRTVDLENGKFTVSLLAGDSVYLLPY